MGRRKKPANETPVQADERLLLESISNHATRSEKTAWKHKLGKMEVLISSLVFIEAKLDKIIEEEKQPLLNKIETLRGIMVEGCVHPYDHLIKKSGGGALCKFCNKIIRVPDGS